MKRYFTYPISLIVFLSFFISCNPSETNKAVVKEKEKLDSLKNTRLQKMDEINSLKRELDSLKALRDSNADSLIADTLR
ncbi:MAG: hypothetical protein KJ799_09575 [Bacteroidetes bacterium]|nr:hypothetical protein [Bacteroidota bacterium]MBU1679259.1 hypothetical protein [Bacteroidota bacterium]MBU2506960.1 hypothetical protein [Bacteroidota bacterium]